MSNRVDVSEEEQITKAWITCSLFGKRPTVHFNEYKPTQAAGPRTLPPISDPQESGEPPKAIKAEHPPEEPPGDRLVLSGLRVSPQNDKHSKAMIA